MQPETVAVAAAGVATQPPPSDAANEVLGARTPAIAAPATAAPATAATATAAPATAAGGGVVVEGGGRAAAADALASAPMAVRCAIDASAARCSAPRSRVSMGRLKWAITTTAAGVSHRGDQLHSAVLAADLAHVAYDPYGTAVDSTTAAASGEAGDGMGGGTSEGYGLTAKAVLQIISRLRSQSAIGERKMPLRGDGTFERRGALSALSSIDSLLLRGNSTTPNDPISAVGRAIACRVELCPSGCVRLMATTSVPAKTVEAAQAGSTLDEGLYPFPLPLCGAFMSEQVGLRQPSLLLQLGGMVAAPNRSCADPTVEPRPPPATTAATAVVAHLPSSSRQPRGVPGALSVAGKSDSGLRSVAGARDGPHAAAHSSVASRRNLQPVTCSVRLDLATPTSAPDGASPRQRIAIQPTPRRPPVTLRPRLASVVGMPSRPLGRSGGRELLPACASLSVDTRSLDTSSGVVADAVTGLSDWWGGWGTLSSRPASSPVPPSERPSLTTPRPRLTARRSASAARRPESAVARCCAPAGSLRCSSPRSATRCCATAAVPPATRSHARGDGGAPAANGLPSPACVETDDDAPASSTPPASVPPHSAALRTALAAAAQDPVVTVAAQWVPASFTSQYTFDFRMTAAIARSRMRLLTLCAAAELAEHSAFEVQLVVGWFKHVRLVRSMRSGTVPPHPTLAQLYLQRYPLQRGDGAPLPAASACAGASGTIATTAAAAATATATAACASADDATEGVDFLRALPESLVPPPSMPSAARARARGVALRSGLHGLACADHASVDAASAALSQCCVHSQHALQCAKDEAAEAALFADVPWRPFSAATKVVGGGIIHTVTPSGLRATYARVAPSTSELVCDGAKPAKLLGAVPGLSATTLATHASALTVAQVRCGFRLVLKSYELDAIAPTPEEARAWVGGINHLPFGGKHRQMIALAHKHPGVAEEGL